MSLEGYWGVGPKTADTLRESLGEEAAVAAIESADVRALTDAGVTPGRATRILRRATGEGAMDALATRDARSVYDDLLDLAAEYAVTRHAADRIRVLTPLPDRAARETRLDEVAAARDAWERLGESSREAVVAAFDEYDEAGGTDRAAVEAVLDLRAAGLTGDTFDALGGVDETALREAADALRYLDGDEVATGADDRLDRLRERRDAAAELADSALDVVESVRERGARDADAFQSAAVEYVATETGVGSAEVRAVAPDEARDAADFVGETLRGLVDDLEGRVTDRAATVREELRSAVDGADTDVETAVGAVDDIAFRLSLARFAAAHELIRPRLGGDGVAVVAARNLTLQGEVQPITYAVGDHDLAAGELESGRTSLPAGDRVTVLTGANSGGKTTLLETLCQVTLLAAMGLPVPADAATVGDFDSVVFHRRHASFNAGVLESTLRSIVPPLSGDGRTLMLVDEFEAITEPGRAADLLNGLVELTVDRGAVGVYVTHLAEDLSPLPDAARIDGIFAEGLTDDLDLRVDYQPRFGSLGKSTPEFIVSRLVANADDRTDRRGFERLAAAVGEEAVQQTLADGDWEPDGE
ncbi:DNA mismatch repair protein [Halobaculum sp. MBLA0147]|uniref:DNA mismatch repair protein n=1 Tax=Halobaculum sp. MBLA0147 TaxID=3079934 RepID=UPI003524B8A3